MRKKLINYLFLLMSYLTLNFTFGATVDHLAKLKSKFPYGLLGDDYGVLNVKDLAINACGMKPEQLSFESGPTVYQYWQCFESKSISFDCDSNGTADPYEGVMGLVIVKASKNHVEHEYLEHRMWPIKQCRDFIKDAATLLHGTRYTCISGSFIDNEKDDSGRQTISWSIERIKTKKGCEGRRCDFTKKYQREHCPNLTW